MRIRRADLPEQNSQAVYQRMQTERQREAAEFRAQGSQKAQEIRAKADRDVTVLLAEATSNAEQIRGEGDAERNRIFAEAFSKDPDFFAFYRSMQAYETGLRANDTRMVLKPDSEFFRYFVDPSGKPRETPSQTTAGAAPTAAVRRRRVADVSRMSDVARSASCSRSRGWCSRPFPAPAKRAMAPVLETPDSPLRAGRYGGASSAMRLDRPAGRLRLRERVSRDVAIR